MASVNNKDTIYVDIDDEITTIIDKVRNSDAKVVALVLPKRASVFQSVVNMKLLKRSAEAAKKHIVLVTTEAGLMPLAGAVGLHVSATPQSKPEIPSLKVVNTDNADITSDSDYEEDAYTAENAGNRPVGELAAADPVETLNLPDEADETTSEEGTDVSEKPARDKHLLVPNFNKFRLGLFLGVLLLILAAIGVYAAAVILPKASVAIATNTSSVPVSLSPTLDTAASALNVSKSIVPAKSDQQQKTTTQQVATTGQKNTGSAATGTVTMSAGSCSGSAPADIPAGSGISTNGLTFITQGDTSFVPVLSHGKCTWQSSGSTDITAQSPGSKYNVNGATFTVSDNASVTADGSATGGTDNIIQIVTQADIDNAKQKLASQDETSIKSSLEQSLTQEGYYALPATFVAGAPVITTSNNVGDQAANVTVTQAVTYTMEGVRQSDLDSLIKNSIDGQINTADQSILSDGLSSATVGVVNTSGSTVQLSFQTSATVGPDINIAKIKQQIAGKKVGDVKSLISNIPGVTNVTVHLSPFWVSVVPNNAAKVTVTVSGASSSAHGGS